MHFFLAFGKDRGLFFHCLRGSNAGLRYKNCDAIAADTPQIRDEQVPDAKIDQRRISNLAGLEQLGHPGGSDGFRLFQISRSQFYLWPADDV